MMITIYMQVNPSIEVRLVVQQENLINTLDMNIGSINVDNINGWIYYVEQICTSHWQQCFAYKYYIYTQKILSLLLPLPFQALIILSFFICTGSFLQNILIKKVLFNSQNSWCVTLQACSLAVFQNSYLYMVYIFTMKLYVTVSSFLHLIF